MPVISRKRSAPPTDAPPTDQVSVAASADATLVNNPDSRGLTGTPPQPDNREQAANSAIESEMLTVKDVAAMLSIGVRSVWRKAQDGRLPPPIKMTGSTRWPKTSLQDWIADQSIAAKSKQAPRRRR